MARPSNNDGALKTIGVTLMVCLVASILVAGSAVLLKPTQEAAKARDREARTVEMIVRVPGLDGLFEPGGPAHLEARTIDLETGQYAPQIDASTFDARAMGAESGVAIPPERDLAMIKHRSSHAVVYLVFAGDDLKLLILPVYGQGFGSTLYGYLGLTPDTQTVVGLSFYEHGETPGLGALIDDPDWRDQWHGKEVWDLPGIPKLGVAAGPVQAGSDEAAYQVDGLTGATWTGRGVTNLLHFWLGEDGFGPYLANVRKGRV